MSTTVENAHTDIIRKSLKNFRMIRSGVDISGIREEISSQPMAWLIDTSRQKNIRVQRNTESIFLRSAHREKDSNISVNEIHESKYTNLSKYFPITTKWLEDVACQMERKVARALIAKLMPKAQVFRHIDDGSYYKFRDRHHLVLWSSDGSRMSSGDESILMHEGELWWFDNKQPHEAFNDSDHDRIHLIFDLEN